MKITYFIGKQLSRLRLAQSYYSIITSTLSTISLIALAFSISLYILLLAFPIILIITYFIGYALDVYNINSMDMLKMNQIQQRFLNTRDIKIQEFHKLQLDILINAISNKDIDIKEYSNELYDNYYKKWKMK